MIMGTFLLGGVDQKVHPILPLLKVIRKKWSSFIVVLNLKG
jgi:hypothetical protein